MPFFLPFMGCGGRCYFCAQNIQTGIVDLPDSGTLPILLEELRHSLQKRAAQGLEPLELAFYGGTFTALCDKDWNLCLEYASEFSRAGLIAGFRCSTRPDALTSARLGELRRAGCVMIELGIQSFCDHSLLACGRGHDSATAIAACQILNASGIKMGIHLMPGLPAGTEASFFADVRMALHIGASCLRIHPCLVLENTKLAGMWRSGEYEPWTLPQAVAATARGWLLAAEGGTPVIRMGLAPEPELAKGILAGPVHPSFGSMVIGHALMLAVGKMLNMLGLEQMGGKQKKLRLHVPKQQQGCLWGWRGEQTAKWKTLGISRENVCYWSENSLAVTIL